MDWEIYISQPAEAGFVCVATVSNRRGIYKCFAKNNLTSQSPCASLSSSIVFNPQIPALQLCSQPTDIFIFGTPKFARSELIIHCEHPGEPQINTCGFVFPTSFPNNQSSTSENSNDIIQ
ncbi:hypothetical protein QUA03_04045 [Microcoleus sp. S36b_A4]|uniref:hypothetical protein n=1 Tax=Microcoleus sp. S36b_A4 TaxID=3055420 RepID=UPI002FD2AD55